MKAIRRILASIRRADETFNLIQDNDKIVVGVSGGKDSLILIHALNLYTKFSKMNFTVIPVMLDLGFPNSDFTKIQQWFTQQNMDLKIVDSKEVYKILAIQQEKQNMKHLPCSICSRMKKAAINKVAEELGANKVAFAHHADDAIETLLMNQIHGGRIATFAPKMLLEKAQMTFIRPLIFARETDIIKACKELNIEPMKSPCPNDKITGREDTKNLLNEIYSKYDDAKDNFLTMLTNYEHCDLWFNRLHQKVSSDGTYVKIVTTKQDTLDMMRIRYEVFVKESKIDFEHEVDGSDEHCVNFLIFKNNKPVGTIRYLEYEPRKFRLGRYAVLKSEQGKGIGRLLFEYVENYLKTKYNPCTIMFHGMYYLNNYYTSMGYQTDGATFDEEGHQHATYIKEIK